MRITLAVALIVSFTMTGCFLDFEQFDERQTPITDTGDVSADGTPDGEADAGDVDDDGDGGTSTPTVGTACSADADCADGDTCRDGYCTRDCAADADCPDGSSCHLFNGTTQCLADCNMDQSCDGVADRSDLSCAAVLSEPDLGATPEARRACVGDSDGDNIADVTDNCPDAANPLQRDRDGDGDGDACDNEPLCHSAADNGLLDYGTVTHAATNYSVPETTNLNWLPVLGGITMEGASVASLAVIDRASGSWSDASDLPYPASGRVVAPTSGNRYVITPGVLEAGHPEFGNYLLVEQDGTTSLGPDYSLSLYDKTLASTGLDRLLVHGYTSDSSSTINGWQIRRYVPSNGQFAVVHSGSDSDRVEWHVTQDMRGNLIFYSKVQPSINIMRMVQVDPLGGQVQSLNLQLPAREPPATGQFDPFIVPGPGNVLYAFDRAVGAAVRIDMGSGSVARVNEFDLNLDVNEANFVAVPGSPSFIVVERSTDDATQLQASEFFLPCLPGTDARDDDSDGVGDITDNCPLTSNTDQKDADGDSIGDACDPDADNDGIPNDSDKTLADDGTTEISLALDTDNDGTDNLDDDDDDNDGIADTADRMPLDTDNDGLHNGMDSDDDSDGYSDTDETTSGTDPLDAVSFPGAGTVSWVRQSDGSRSVEYAEVIDIANPKVLSLGGAAAPYYPRFVGDGSSMFALAGEPGTATGVHLLSTDPNADPAVQTFDAGVTLRGADPATGGLTGGALTAIVAAHPTADDPNRWQLSQINVTDQTSTALVTMFGDVDSPRAAGTNVAFLGAPADCTPCLKPYVVPSTGGTPQAITSGVNNPQQLRYDGSTIFMIADASDGVGTSGYLITGGRIREIRPPGITEVDSFERAGSDGHMVLSGRAASGEPYTLWLYNGRTGQWHQILEAAEDLVEVDWIDAVPAPPEVVEPSE